MAAYASLVSLMQIIHQIEHHLLPPISLEREQVESLTKNVSFLQEFLEAHPYIGNNEEGFRLENRIAGAAYMAEDIIESHIVDQILDGNYGDRIISVEFYRRLQKVVEDIDLIKKEVLEIREKMGFQHKLSVAHGGSSTSSSTLKNNTIMVGFDDIELELMDKLTGGRTSFQIIVVAGMGGMGKTTLARNAYARPLINERFDICAWATISQDYDARKILDEVLCQTSRSGRDSNNNTESEVGESLYKYLYGRRYLIVMDDMWSIDAWDKIRFFFPDNNNGSRVVVTTRLSTLASQLTNSCIIAMRFLDDDESWDLFSKIVFPEDDFPSELLEIGKSIVRSCRGLPLSIVVVGGILAKSGLKREFWEHVEENMYSIINSETDEQCLKILEMSYNHLPVHLKPCFLYMGIFKEDSKIPVSMLVKLWVVEGFIKPVGDKNLEEIAREYVKDLVDRNLILVHELGRCTKNIKYIKIHDLLRDLCLRQAVKERFYNVVKRYNVGTPQDAHSQRRLVITDDKLEDSVKHALSCMPLARSLICNFGKAIRSYPIGFRGIRNLVEVLRSPHHRLLRIFEAGDAKLHNYHSKLVNLRFIFVRNISLDLKFASPFNFLWNLQMLFVHDSITLPVEFWNMPQLRHVKVISDLYLPDPESYNFQDEIVLENLQTLMYVKNFKLSEYVVMKIPNIKKLRIRVEEDSSDFDLSNLDQLHKLESFSCNFSELTKSLKLTFPYSLKKLTLRARSVDYWEEMLEKIGSLPLLQILVLWYGCFRTKTWKTVEGQFSNLRVLEIYYCDSLIYWMTESSHFPRLEHLELFKVHGLDEIPSGIGEIQTLRLIELFMCKRSLVESAKRIQEEQEELYGEEASLQVKV